MPNWRPSLWLAAAGVLAVCKSFGVWVDWEDSSFWTRLHSTIGLGTGLAMLLGAIGLLAVRGGVRWLIVVSAIAAALLGMSLVGGVLAGTIPCSGPT
jgi:hypothetical protein